MLLCCDTFIYKKLPNKKDYKKLFHGSKMMDIFSLLVYKKLKREIVALSA